MSSNRILTSLLVSLTLTTVGAQDPIALPKLVVNITIDQLRTDYMEAFLPLYGENGFRRLLKEGRQYPNAQYSSYKPDRASAIASIATGATPYENGIVGQYWLNRKTLQPIYCVYDEEQKGTQKASPHNLIVSTISDELKSATEGKAIVYSIAPYSDAAVLSAGHAADGAIWIDDKTGKWCSSLYYSALPSWAQTINEQEPLYQRLKRITWEPTNEMVGNFSYFLSGGIKKPFKHKFDGVTCVSDFKSCGLVNEEVSKMAQACLKHSLLGNDDITDYLSLTFYAGNYKKAPSSETSLELQDTYVRLDKALNDVFDAIEQHVGIDHSFIVVTSTGYVPEEQTNPAKYQIPSGTFYINRTAALLNMYLAAIYGQGQYIEANYNSELYFNYKLLEQKQLKLSEILERSRDFLMQTNGVKNAYTADQLQQGEGIPGLNKLHNAYNPHCSGDLLIQIIPGWHLVNENTRLNKLIRESYVPFPIIFLGSHIQSGIIDTPVSTECIAPTLAKAIRIRAPNACSTKPIPGIH